MTMAAAARKQGIILGRLWKALLLSRSKRLKENKKLMKIPKRAKKNLPCREATARFDSPDFGLPVLIQLVYLLMIRIDTQF